MTDGPHTHLSVTGKMVGTADFLAHWHTSIFVKHECNLCEKKLFLKKEI